MKCPTCGSKVMQITGDEGFIPYDVDKLKAEIVELKQQLINYSDYTFALDEIDALRQALAERAAYGQSLRSTLSRMLKDDFSLEELDSALALSPSPQLLNKLKADAVREAVKGVDVVDLYGPSSEVVEGMIDKDDLLEYADKLEKRDD